MAATKVTYKFQGIVLGVPGVKITVANTVHIDPIGRAMPMKDLARMLSKGTLTIPARPFMRDFARDQRSALLVLIKQNLKIRKVKVTDYDGKRWSMWVGVLNWQMLGKDATDFLSEWVFSGNYYKAKVPNAPTTIKKKGNDIPLVELKQLAKSFVWSPLK